MTVTNLSMTCVFYLPVALEGAKVTDLHAAGPALLGGGAAAHLAQDHQLRARLAVQAQALKFIQQHILTPFRLHASHCFTTLQLWNAAF
jgi:hypothetical protein